MNLSENITPSTSDDHIFTLDEYLAYGDRLHANTAIDFAVNSVAAYVVLRHSTKAMGIYKYYILSTIAAAFLMDFHSTFIFGPFLTLPSTVMCGSGVVARHLDYLWGQVLQYALMSIFISCVGWSITYCLFYQYFQLRGNTDFFHSPWGITLLIILPIVYPFPSLAFVYFSLDYSKSLNHVKQNFPRIYPLFIQAPCYTVLMDEGGREHYTGLVIQILFVATVALIVALKIHRKLLDMKHLISESTMRAKKQFLYSLVLQLTIPMLFILIPVTAALIICLLDLENLSCKSIKKMSAFIC